MANRLERALAIIITGRDVSASKTIRGVNKELGKLGKAGTKAVGNLWGNLQRGAVIAGGAAVGATAYAVKAAMDFQSSSASVAKTVDGNIESIINANRELAKTTGMEVNTLNEISATAGALGIAKDDIDDFTKTIALLGVTTDDVSTDVGASAIGHLKTTLNLAGTDFEHFGNTLVYLGNHGASTEGQILSMAENIAGAAATVGASTPQVLGWASALANTGEEAEAGGTSIQKFWLESFKSISQGGTSLHVMSKISGQTMAQFKKDFGKDATGTLAKFMVALGKLSKAEQLDVLEKLGLKDIRITRAMLKLLANTDNLTDSLAQSERGWKENRAAADEAAKRFETTASKVKILQANVKDAAITIGTELLPLIGELADEGTDWLQGHQPEIKQFAKDLAAGIREAVKWAKSLDWDAIGLALKAGAEGAKAILGFFMALPPEAKAILAGGFALNKLTGGLATDLGKIAFDMFAGRGSSPANPLYVQGIGLGGAAAGGSAIGNMGRIASLASKVFIVGAAIGVFAELKGILDEQSAANRQQEGDLATKTGEYVKTATVPQMEQALAGLQADNDRLLSELTAEGLAYQLDIDGVRTAFQANMATIEAAINERKGVEAGTKLATQLGFNTAPYGPPTTGPASGGMSPTERGEALAGIITRSKAAGRTPRDINAAAQATLQRTLVREQQATKRASERTAQRVDAARSSAIASAATVAANVVSSGLAIVAAIQGLNLPAPIVNVDNTARSVAINNARWDRVNNRPKTGTGPTID